MAVTITQDRLKEVLKEIEALTQSRVLVGIPDSGAGRSDGMLNNAEIGYIHETGSPAANIPARPFLHPGIDKAISRIVPTLEKGARKALGGDKDAAREALEKVGLIAQNSVRAEISSNIPPPLAESTLRRRKARGRTGERTLVDTGQLRASITYVIEKIRGRR